MRLMRMGFFDEASSCFKDFINKNPDSITTTGPGVIKSVRRGRRGAVQGDSSDMDIDFGI